MKSRRPNPPVEMIDDEFYRRFGDECLLNIRQAAIYLSVSESTLNHWRSGGKGPSFVKLGDVSGGAVRYRMADLRAYTGKNMFSSTAESGVTVGGFSRMIGADPVFGAAHPFIVRTRHFVVDSAYADLDTFIGCLTDPTIQIRWMTPEEALTYPWLRAEKRRALLGIYLNTAGAQKAEDIRAAYSERINQIPERLFCGHPDLTIETLVKGAGGAYPVEFVKR